MQYLSTAKFNWLTQNGIKKIDANTIHEDDTDVFMLEVDVGYLEWIYNLDNDYTLVPEINWDKRPYAI